MTIEHFSQYSREYLTLLDIKYHLAYSKNDLTQCFEVCEQGFKLARILYGEAHHKTMRAYFRMSVVKGKLLSQSIAVSNEQLPMDYPRLKITHPSVFRVLIPIYTGDQAKLNELLQVIYG